MVSATLGQLQGHPPLLSVYLSRCQTTYDAVSVGKVAGQLWAYSELTFVCLFSSHTGLQIQNDSIPSVFYVHPTVLTSKLSTLL